MGLNVTNEPISWQVRPFDYPTSTNPVGASAPPLERNPTVGDKVRLVVEGHSDSDGGCWVRIMAIDGAQLRGVLDVSTRSEVAGGPGLDRGTEVEFREEHIFSYSYR